MQAISHLLGLALDCITCGFPLELSGNLQIYYHVPILVYLIDYNFNNYKLFCSIFIFIFLTIYNSRSGISQIIILGWFNLVRKNILLFFTSIVCIIRSREMVIVITAACKHASQSLCIVLNTLKYCKLKI